MTETQLTSRFYLITLRRQPVYVGYTNRPIKQRFAEHKREILAELPQDIGWLTPAGFIKKPLKRDPLIDVDWLIWLMMKSNAVAGLVALNAKKLRG